MRVLIIALLLLIAALLLAGCSANLTDEEREERDFQREYRTDGIYNDWVMCQQVFRDKGVRWVTLDAGSKIRNKNPHRTTMLQEIRYNKCRINRDRL